MINMTTLETSILEEQLYYFIKFLETNDFLDFQDFLSDDVTKDELIDSIIFNFILDHYGEVL